MNCYELWGNDTFSNETYLCGVYKHYSSARRAMKRHQLDCMKTQGDGLRDTFWIEDKTVDEHVAHGDRRKECVASVHERADSDMELVLKNISSIYLFARDTVHSLGVYEYSLPEEFKESDIESVSFIMRRESGSKAKYELAIYVKFCPLGEYFGVTGCIKSGTKDELLCAMKKPEISAQYLSFIFESIRKHYCSRLLP